MNKKGLSLSSFPKWHCVPGTHTAFTWMRYGNSSKGNLSIWEDTYRLYANSMTFPLWDLSFPPSWNPWRGWHRSPETASRWLCYTAVGMPLLSSPRIFPYLKETLGPWSSVPFLPKPRFPYNCPSILWFWLCGRCPHELACSGDFIYMESYSIWSSESGSFQ